jgi:protein-disulfide isomerase
MNTQENTETNKFLVPLSIVIAGVMVAGAIYFGGGGTASAVNKPNNPASIDLAKVTDKDYIVGNRNAPIVIVEYSDIECPFCKVFHNTMKTIVSDYNGQVAWVYRHFPIPQLHKNAMIEAEATECAAEQGGNTAFWNYIDKLFETTNSNDSLDLAQLPIIAGSLGLDVAAFNECLSTNRYASKIQKSVEGAVKAGARGTPYSIIVAKDGTKVVINGAEGVASIKTKIDSLLK